MNNHRNNGEVRYPDPLLYDTVLKIPEAEGCKTGKALWQEIENKFPAEEKYEILAPGIGTGRFVIPFLLAIPDEDRHKVQVYAIEKDPDMSSYLKEKLQKLELQALVVFPEDDFEKYDTEDDKERFHACFAFFIFHHLKDPIKGIDKMVSFLKPNGLFFFSEEQGDKILWDTNFQHVNYKELPEIIKDEGRLSFVRSAYSFSRRLARKGRIRYPLISAGDNTATIDYLEEIGLTNLWDNNNKQEFSFYQDLKKDEWFETIRKGMFSFLPNRVAKEYPKVIDDTEKNLPHSKFTIKNRLRIYAFQAKKTSQAANETLPARRIKQASVLRFAQRIIDDDTYKDEDLFQNELKNRLQVMENHGFFEKSVFVYLASWALHKEREGRDGKWRDKVPVWISKVNDSDDSRCPWNFIATQFLYLLLSRKDPLLSNFMIVDFVLHDMPDKCILAVEYFDNPPSRWDVNFDRFGKVEKITIPCSKRLVSLLTPFLEDITSTVEYLKDRISRDVRETKKGWTMSLKKLVDPDSLDGSTFNTEPIRHKMKEVVNDAEFKRAIAEGKKFFEDVSKFTGRKSWKFPKNQLENQLTKLFIALLYTGLVGSLDKQRKWSHLYYIPGATHSEALLHDEKEHSSFCWMMLCDKDKELLEPEERYLRLIANLYGRADSTWGWAKRGEAKGIKILLGSMSHSTRHYANAILTLLEKDYVLARMAAVALEKIGIWGQLCSGFERSRSAGPHKIFVRDIIKGFLHAWVLQYSRFYSQYEKEGAVLPPLLCFQMLFRDKQPRHYFVPGIFFEGKELNIKVIDSLNPKILMSRDNLSAVIDSMAAGENNWASYFPDIFRQTILGVQSVEGIESFFQEIFLNAIKHSHKTYGENPLIIHFLWDEKNSDIIFQIKNPVNVKDVKDGLYAETTRSGTIGLKYIAENLGWNYTDPLDGKTETRKNNMFVVQIKIPRSKNS